MFFSAITNWQILTKNSVTFKRSDGVMDEKFMGNSPKNPISVLGGGGGRGGGFLKNHSIVGIA